MDKESLLKEKQHLSDKFNSEKNSFMKNAITARLKEIDEVLLKTSFKNEFKRELGTLLGKIESPFAVKCKEFKLFYTDVFIKLCDVIKTDFDVEYRYIFESDNKVEKYVDLYKTELKK